ncbi:MAG: hypothetical protein WC523_04540 [Patescibacteria group bacterium]
MKQDKEHALYKYLERWGLEKYFFYAYDGSEIMVRDIIYDNDVNRIRCIDTFVKRAKVATNINVWIKNSGMIFHSMDEMKEYFLILKLGITE